mmetsp:Transcript_34339/g.69396  ORF Transcript_34339/g.69396 Transcript_34339/m.69396 type:complete len:298 (-) Transcript_34339:127-1020(-)
MAVAPSHILIRELPRLRKLRHLPAAADYPDLALEGLGDLEHALLRLAGQEAALAPGARLGVEELLPGALLLHRVFFDPVNPLLLLDRLDLSFLRLDDVLRVGLLDDEALGDLVARGRGDLLEGALLLGRLAGGREPDLVEPHLRLGPIVREGELVALLRLLRDHALIPQAVLREDGLTPRPRLALSWMWRPEHLHIGDLVFSLVLESNEVTKAALDAAIIASHRLDLGIVPLLLVEGLASPPDERCVHRLLLWPPTAAGGGLGGRSLLGSSGGGRLVLDQVLCQHDDFRQVVLQLHQ